MNRPFLIDQLTTLKWALSTDQKAEAMYQLGRIVGELEADIAHSLAAVGQVLEAGQGEQHDGDDDDQADDEQFEVTTPVSDVQAGIEIERSGTIILRLVSSTGNRISLRMDPDGAHDFAEKIRVCAVMARSNAVASESR